MKVLVEKGINFRLNFKNFLLYTQQSINLTFNILALVSSSTVVGQVPVYCVAFPK